MGDVRRREKTEIGRCDSPIPDAESTNELSFDIRNRASRPAAQRSSRRSNGGGLGMPGLTEKCGRPQ